MGTDDLRDILLLTLPTGARVVSAMHTDRTPPTHVYRVLSRAGTLVHECSTLIELKIYLDTSAYDSP